MEKRMSVVLSGQVILEQATPEYLARFDSYPGNPSNLDLGITGYLKRSSLKEGLFVGVEAKVDETFGGLSPGNTALQGRSLGPVHPAVVLRWSVKVND